MNDGYFQLLVAHKRALQSLKTYAHRFAPKKIIQHWRVAYLVLKAHHNKDYRVAGVIFKDGTKIFA
jgi:hypothetical protein